MITITRGSDVAFTTSFKNSSGQSFEPANAIVTVAYTANGTATTSDITMELNAAVGTWHAKWASKVSDPCQVDWFIKTGGDVESTDQGSFLLVANSANQL